MLTALIELPPVEEELLDEQAGEERRRFKSLEQGT